MSTWLIIGVCVQVAWMVYQGLFIRTVTFKDVFDFIFQYGLIGMLGGIVSILINIFIWPLALIFNVILTAYSETLKRPVDEEEESK